MTSETNVHVALSDRPYDIAIRTDRLPQSGELVRKWLADRDFRSESALIVTDENVSAVHATPVRESLDSNGFRTEQLVITPGEPSKCQATIDSAYDRLVDMMADRQTVVVAVGGGVVGDAAGFIAASFMRGLPFIQVPTSLLAHVDSSVGGKTGINHPQGKNLIGAFHQPVGVFCDTHTLTTLSDRDYRSGLAEVIKYGVILDELFFRFLEENVSGLNDRDPEVMRQVIARSCRLKADVVEEDEFERTGKRAILNYGHTFAHAFEALCGYGELLHGEAVSIGMHYASRLADYIGLLDPRDTERQVRLMEAVGLPVRLHDPEAIEIDAIVERMRLDKKTIGGQLRFVLPTRIGRVKVFKDVAEDDVRYVLNEMRSTRTV